MERADRQTIRRAMVVILAEVERAGMRLLAEDEGYRVVAEAADGETALRLAEDTKPDIVIVDGALSDVPALGLAHFIMRKCPRTQILLYTDSCSRDGIDLALREGVRAFVLKSRVSKHLRAALRALSDNRPYWEDAVADDLLEEYLEGGADPPLSSHEWQVLQMAAEQRTATEIARALGISPKTAEAHRTHLRRKLGYRTKADLIRFVAKREL